MSLDRPRIESLLASGPPSRRGRADRARGHGPARGRRHPRPAADPARGVGGRGAPEPAALPRRARGAQGGLAEDPPQDRGARRGHPRQHARGPARRARGDGAALRRSGRGRLPAGGVRPPRGRARPRAAARHALDRRLRPGRHAGRGRHPHRVPGAEHPRGPRARAALARPRRRRGGRARAGAGGGRAAGDRAAARPPGARAAGPARRAREPLPRAGRGLRARPHRRVRDQPAGARGRALRRARRPAQARAPRARAPGAAPGRRRSGGCCSRAPPR